MNKEKTTMAIEFTQLESKMEQNSSLDIERRRLKEVGDKLNKIWSQEDIKARQRSRDREMQEGTETQAIFRLLQTKEI
jgi:regulator of replication initiation timing